MRTLVLALLLAVALSQAHPICIDSTNPVVRAGTFAKCPQYNGRRACVNPANENSAVRLPRFSAGASQSCRKRMQQVACAVVDPWSGHLFRAEGPSHTRSVTIVCPTYCESIWNDCSGTQMSHHPFVNGATSFTTIAHQYGNKAAFCQKFAAEEYCYKGEPFSIPPAKPFVANFTTCVEKVIGPGMPRVSIQPIPGFPNLMVFGDLSGVVRVYRTTDATGIAFQLVNTLIDISEEVEFGGEMGLLGVALHKNFSTNGRIYLSYNCNGNQASVDCDYQDSIVDEFQILDLSNANSLVADKGTRRRIIRVAQPYANHNGGQVLFSPDPDEPNLFFMLGDGGSGGDPQNRAQPITSMYGKVHRIDVDTNMLSKGPGIAPRDNPFYRVRNARKTIWANGLRNPWRCSFDRETYLMYCGDVGQNKIEEIDIITKGANYGWRRFEGTSIYNGRTALRGSRVHTPPILTYTHSEVSDSGYASVTGGYVIRGTKDSQMTGKYIFADISEALFLAQESPANSGQWKRSRVGMRCVTSGSPITCSQPPSSILSFGEMQNGDILAANEDGSVFRFVEPARCNTSG